MNILYIFGGRETTQKNKKILVRKRLFHKGYQISSVTWDSESQEEYFELIEEFNTIQGVNNWIKQN